MTTMLLNRAKMVKVNIVIAIVSTSDFFFFEI